MIIENKKFIKYSQPKSYDEKLLPIEMLNIVY